MLDLPPPEEGEEEDKRAKPHWRYPGLPRERWPLVAKELQGADGRRRAQVYMGDFAAHRPKPLMVSPYKDDQ
eukprot:5316634-Prorocentrum_lima.AAC.1